MNAAASYDIIWEFTIVEDRRPDFEAAYGPHGEWARLFKRADGYIESRLLRDMERPNVYLTVDRWHSRDDFEQFMRIFADEYRDLDARLEDMAGVERRIGAYTCLAPLASASALG